MTELEPYMSVADFAKHNVACITANRVGRNPNMPNTDMDHWRCVLYHPCGSKMVVYFSQGYGHHGKAPTVEDILDCLASDAARVENARSFEEWASECGYDPDSRKALKTYETCVKQANELKSFLGIQYQILLYGTERL